ncbi:hypothetical protein TRFO_39073 [Tritrichomonas foetus]|uniref:Thioredoxin domain-containing protein n=1 Tax=Tritrichomonas foetus TaxID=1144522 RepID=A0A1J4JBB8_9EUKA|nr:hypothetical protein TRFO_39073 [Tritrichomonas foetus]|eukprot:OHS94725.1 hypothetical protein TRFO_39073 [Tritrichomonas foetus]
MIFYFTFLCLGKTFKLTKYNFKDRLYGPDAKLSLIKFTSSKKQQNSVIEKKWETLKPFLENLNFLDIYYVSCYELPDVCTLFNIKLAPALSIWNGKDIHNINVDENAEYINKTLNVLLNEPIKYITSIEELHKINRTHKYLLCCNSINNHFFQEYLNFTKNIHYIDEESIKENNEEEEDHEEEEDNNEKVNEKANKKINEEYNEEEDIEEEDNEEEEEDIETVNDDEDDNKNEEENKKSTIERTSMTPKFAYPKSKFKRNDVIYAVMYSTEHTKLSYYYNKIRYSSNTFGTNVSHFIDFWESCENNIFKLSMNLFYQKEKFLLVILPNKYTYHNLPHYSKSLIRTYKSAGEDRFIEVMLNYSYHNVYNNQTKFYIINPIKKCFYDYINTNSQEESITEINNWIENIDNNREKMKCIYFSSIKSDHYFGKKTSSIHPFTRMILYIILVIIIAIFVCVKFDRGNELNDIQLETYKDQVLSK